MLVADPHPDPLDPCVFGPLDPSVCQGYRTNRTSFFKFSFLFVS
jgi:hypothetical protein